MGALLLSGILAWGDTWRLKNGSELQGEVMSFRNGMVVLSTAGGRQLLQIEAFMEEDQERIRKAFPGGDRAQRPPPPERKKPDTPAKPEKEPGKEVPEAPARDQLPHLRYTSIGDYPPEFQVTSPGSPTAVDFRSFRGRLVLVHFWSPRVEVSLQTLPELVKLHEKYSPMGLQMVDIALERNRPTVVNIRRQAGITWPGAVDRDQKLSNAFGIQMLPTVVLVNHAGVIVSDNRRISEIEAEIRKHMGLPPE